MLQKFPWKLLLLLYSFLQLYTCLSPDAVVLFENGNRGPIQTWLPELWFNKDEVNTYMDMAPKMGYGFKNKPLIGSNTNSYCLRYTSMLGARWQKYFRWLFCIGTLVIAFRTLHAIYWAETRGYVITSTKMTLLHLIKKCDWNTWRTLLNFIHVNMGVEYMLQSGQNVLWYNYESQNS